MSDGARTDEAMYYAVNAEGELFPVVDSCFAYELERKLNAANTELALTRRDKERLISTVAELRRDKARLDHADRTMYFDENGECGWYISRVNHGDIRHEIDMAMQEGGEG